MNIGQIKISVLCKPVHISFKIKFLIGVMGKDTLQLQCIVKIIYAQIPSHSLSSYARTSVYIIPFMLV